MKLWKKMRRFFHNLFRLNHMTPADLKFRLTLFMYKSFKIMWGLSSIAEVRPFCISFSDFPQKTFAYNRKIFIPFCVCEIECIKRVFFFFFFASFCFPSVNSCRVISANYFRRQSNHYEPTNNIRVVMYIHKQFSFTFYVNTSNKSDHQIPHTYIGLIRAHVT